MNTRRKQIAALTGTSVAVAFGAYALGSQAGDGSAVAERSSSSNGATAAFRAVHDGRGPGGPHGAGLAGLADRLGVEESALEDALADIRPGNPRRERRDAFAEGLASKLGLDADKVEGALDKLRPDRGGRRNRGNRGDRGPARFASALGRELGVSAAKVRAAFEKVHDGGPPRNREAAVKELADELGVTEAKLRSAFDEVKPAGRRGGPGAAALAKELGVDQDKVEAALKELRAEHEAEHEKRRDEFAKALADRLNIPVDKVKEELAAARPRGRHGP
jgi:Clp amino terminal domain, pathogenicity island component